MFHFFVKPLKSLVLLITLLGLLPAICASQQQPIVLRGTIVTPERVIQRGSLVIENGKISGVHEKAVKIPRAIVVDTRGIIFPGLIDLHNHVPWNVFKHWHAGQLFSNRYEWRFRSDEYIKTVLTPNRNISPAVFCDMNTYGELRALVGGTTSILTTTPRPCIQGLVRNLDFSSGFYGATELNRERIRNEIDIRARNPNKTEEDDKRISDTLEEIREKLATKRLDAFLIHLAEGKATDQISKQEFDILQKEKLLTNKTIIIHGVALGATEFQAMHDAGTSLVWSPRSNIELYGETTDIRTALDKGIKIALAPDWTISGSSNMLDELRYAAEWNEKHLGKRLSDRDLVNMVTTTPAEITGIADKVGSIREGLNADLLIISGDRSQPYRSLVQAEPGNVRLVMIGGVPVYGSASLMSRFWNRRDLDELPVGGNVKTMVKMPNSEDRYRDIEVSLRRVLAHQGITLAPLVERH